MKICVRFIHAPLLSSGEDDAINFHADKFFRIAIFIAYDILTPDSEISDIRTRQATCLNITRLILMKICKISARLRHEREARFDLC